MEKRRGPVLASSSYLHEEELLLYCYLPQLDTGSKSKLTSNSLGVTQGLAHFD